MLSVERGEFPNASHFAEKNARVNSLDFARDFELREDCNFEESNVAARATITPGVGVLNLPASQRLLLEQLRQMPVRFLG
jgi:hypothetical protein